MHIYPNETEPARPEVVCASLAADAVDSDGILSISSVDSSSDLADTVSTSASSLALAVRDGFADMLVVDSRHVDRVRKRVLSGAYDSLEVVDALARRLLNSGDL